MSTSRRSSRNSNKGSAPQAAPATAQAPAPTFSTPNPESSQQEKKARYTRAEKRAFAREKAASNPFLPTRPRQTPRSHTTSAPKSLKPHYEAPTANIDNMIGFLISQRGAGKKAQAKAINSVFQGFRLEERPVGGKKVGERKKKEISAAKMEKVLKRKEIRAEKRKVYLAEKAARGEGEGVGSVVETKATTAVVEQQPLPDDDEINFDEL